MDAAAIEEANRMRASLGLKPLPVPGAAPTKSEDASDSDDDAPSTLESRQAKAYENFQKLQDAEEAKKKREEKAAAIKKARDAAARFATLEGKGLGDEDLGADMDAKSWLMSQKKRQKKIDKARKLQEEKAAAEAKAAADRQYTSEDLAGVKVSHDVSSFMDGDEQILTLKDTTIEENEEEGDELEAVSLREQEKVAEKLELKKKKPAYNPWDDEGTGERSILAQYDEEIEGKKKKRFTLDAQGTLPDLPDILGAPTAGKEKVGSINLDDVVEPAQSSDYMEIKVKKPKKRSKAKRRRGLDEDDILLPEPEVAPATDIMDVDTGVGVPKKRKVTDDDLIDDDDLQASLAKQRHDALKKRKKNRPEDIARQLKEATDNELDNPEQGGVVIDEISEFVSGLKKEDLDEKRSRPAKPLNEEAVTAMDVDSDDDGPVVKRHQSEEEDGRQMSPLPDISAIGVDEEKTVGGSGIGATLSILKERGLLKESNTGKLTESYRQQQFFLAEKRRRLDEFEEEARRQRERDRASGKLDRMSQREREEYARQQNTYRDQQMSRIMNDLFKQGYRPNVELKYTDDDGRRLNNKEAFKHLSHKFHGKGSGKGKTDKRLKKIEDERRREAQSMLDASQNVGMSSAAAQQIKKRREAGVRLG